jgi:epoxyqueuosine reductase
MTPFTEFTDAELLRLKGELRADAAALGFSAIGVSGVELEPDAAHLERWLEAGFHGEMDYMQRHGRRRTHPEELVPGTLRVVSARMDYWPAAAAPAEDVLADATLGYVSRYALGRDYHKVLRRGLARLARRLAARVGPLGARVFVDSGPVLEKALARNAGLGWIGKHTNLIARDAGSWFFLGEILTDLPLPTDPPASAHCGSCEACIPACPTGAIVAPYRLDARRCISYLTIELKGAIPEEWRSRIGNRIYGCDDCQLVCPWNKFAQAAAHPDFRIRERLDRTRLVELFGWSAEEFELRTRGSALHRLGHERWLRNLAVALGNGPPTAAARAALRARSDAPSALVREHVAWARARLAAGAGA